MAYGQGALIFVTINSLKARETTVSGQIRLQNVQQHFSSWPFTICLAVASPPEPERVTAVFSLRLASGAAYSLADWFWRMKSAGFHLRAFPPA